ncbi:MAG: MFS transporter [Thermoflexaceae bacterium]|nr:MFS transporter [Thermoflexaceae bacterium]
MNIKKITFTYIMIHVVFWCSYAIAWSYTAVYLKSCGYDNSVVGLVTGIGAVISVILQPVLASATIRFPWMNNKTKVILLKILSLILAVAIMAKMPGIYTIAVLFTLIAAIDASIPSMLSSMAMEYVNAGKDINYGLARGTGSIAYALISLFLGYAVEWLGTQFLMVLYIFLGMVTAGITVFFPYEDQKKEKTKKDNQRRTGISALFGKYVFLPFFLTASIVLFMGHNMVNVFLLNIIERAGGNSTNLGLALAIAAGVELPVMMFFVKLEKRIKVEKLLVISAVFFTVKSVFTLFAVNVGLVYLMQFLQFGAFALFTPASVYFINKAMEQTDSGIGQALLGSCSLGLGGTLGNVLGGFILDGAGVDAMIWCTVILSAVGIGLMGISARIYEKTIDFS